jgi:hypothetical protein
VGYRRRNTPILIPRLSSAPAACRTPRCTRVSLGCGTDSSNGRTAGRGIMHGLGNGDQKWTAKKHRNGCDIRDSACLRAADSTLSWWMRIFVSRTVWDR